MTTIVAVQTRDDVILAWDSQTTVGNQVILTGQSKVWCRDGIVYGCAGSSRFGDMIYAMDAPAYDGSDARRWIVRNLVPAIYEAVESGKTTEFIEEDGSLRVGLLVVVDGTVFELDGALSVGTSTDGVCGIGSGSQYAMGAIHGGVNVEDAVKIAAMLDPFTGGAVHVASANELIMAEDVD